KPDLLFLEFSGFYILSNLQLSRFFVVGLFSSNFYILSQSLVFVNNFFNFFISYSLALLVLTAAQEISYQMLQQMSTGFFNFFHFLHFSIFNLFQSLRFPWFNRLKSDMTERINKGFFLYSSILLSSHINSNSL
ncbi:hypothetical protein HMPREF1085_03199, partial [Enterocloster bolteae 90A9]